MIEEALNYYESGDYASATPLFREMLAEEPDNLEVLYILALSLQKQGQADEALELLGRALSLEPANPVLHIATGSVCVQVGDFAAAEEAFSEAARLDANRVEAQNGLAFAQLAQGRAEKAEQTLRHALKADERNVQALFNMGIALFRQSRWTEAINYLNEVIAAEPDNAPAQAYLGRAFLSSGNAGFAIQCFENALKLGAQTGELLRWMAEAQRLSGQLEDAAESYRKLLASQGEQPDILFGLARVELRLGKQRHSEQMFLRGLHLKPDDLEALFDYCELLLAQSRNREVRNRIEQSGVMENPPERALYLLARASLASGDASEALDLLRPLIAGGDLAAETRLLLARILLATGEVEAADQQIDRLLGQDRPPVEAVILRAGRLDEQGRSEEAARLLKDAQRRHDLKRGQRRAVSRLLGKILHRAGRYQSAYEQFLAIDRAPPAVLRIREDKAPQQRKSQPPETAMNRDLAWSWPAKPPADRCPRPIFVFGWPGSGRTALLEALAACPDVMVTDDDFEAQRERRWLLSYPQGAAPLDALDETQIRLARRRYLKMLRRIEPEVGKRIVIDALWLNTEALPTLYRLFPTARILILTRDARDMAGAWMQAGYDQLERMARVYAEQLRLADLCFETVPLEYVKIAAEALESDAEGALEELCGRLDLPWSPAVAQRFGNARQTEWLEAGAWRHYAEWLKPALQVFSEADRLDRDGSGPRG